MSLLRNCCVWGCVCVCVCVFEVGTFVKHVNQRYTHTQYTSTGDAPAIGDILSLKKGFKTIKKGMYFSPLGGENSLLDLGVLIHLHRLQTDFIYP